MKNAPFSEQLRVNGNGNGDGDGSSSRAGLRGFLRNLFRIRGGDGSARDTLKEMIEDREEKEVPIEEEERLLLANILALSGRTVEDVMVPRVDIVALEAGAPLSEVIEVMTSKGHSRIPVFRETLDDALGMVHIKDVLAWRGSDRSFSLNRVLRKVLFVSPSMQVLELLLEMRVQRSHMALVVDEYGGVDGLVTIEDLVEEIVGEIEDEHDRETEPVINKRQDGTIDADARTEIETLEAMIGPFVTEEEGEDVHTLGGLVFTLAGRVPIRGELIGHASGVEFEVLDADPRHIRRLRVHIPSASYGDCDAQD